MKSTLVVNLFGSPGTGKSTIAASVFAELKWKGIDCELVTEFAKDLTWEERHNTLQNQVYVFAKQFHRISRLNSKVDVIVTDSPLLLSAYYNDKYCNISYMELNSLVLEQHNNFNNLNIFLNRVKPYNPNGRNQSEDESNQISKDIEVMLINSSIDYLTLDGTKKSVLIIVNEIMKELSEVG